MIDIHTHILYGVDDGAQSLREAMALIEQSVDNDTTELILTPHGNWDYYVNSEYDLLEEVFDELRQICAEQLPDVTLYLGMEVYASDDLYHCLAQKQVFPLDQGNFLLLEFPFDADELDMAQAIEDVREFGFSPIIAHAERYHAVQRRPELAYEWNSRGVCIQVNAGSLLGDFGRRVEETALSLLRHNLVQFVASDCHNTHNRPAGLREVYRFLSRYFSEGTAELLTEVNPRRMLRGEQPLIINPMRFSRS